MSDERERVTTLERLVELAHEKKSVCIDMSTTWHVKPAAFVINMSGFMINQYFERGMYVYEKEKTNE
jgi:hypothetical protein